MARKRRRKGSRAKSRRTKSRRTRGHRKTSRRKGGRRAASRRRRPKGRKHRPVLYKSRGRWRSSKASRSFRGKRTRVNGRRRHRRNPGLKGFLPSISGVTDILKVGAGVGIGYVAVNVVKIAADRFVPSLKAGRSPTVVAAINAALGALVGVPLAGYLGGMVLGSKFKTSIYAGAAWNVVQHLANDLAAPHLPSWGSALLLDYDSAAKGMFDFVTAGGGMNDYIIGGGANSGAMPGGGNDLAMNAEDAVGAFI